MRNSLVVQWLRLGAFTAGAQVQSLVGELRTRKPRGEGKKKSYEVATQSLPQPLS